MLGMETALTSQLKGRMEVPLNNEKQVNYNLPNPIRKRNSKSIKELEAGRYSNSSKENMGRTHCDRNGSKLFLDPLLE